MSFWRLSCTKGNTLRRKRIQCTNPSLLLLTNPKIPPPLTSTTQETSNLQSIPILPPSPCAAAKPIPGEVIDYPLFWRHWMKRVGKVRRIEENFDLRDAPRLPTLRRSWGQFEEHFRNFLGSGKICLRREQVLGRRSRLKPRREM